MRLLTLLSLLLGCDNTSEKPSPDTQADTDTTDTGDTAPGDTGSGDTDANDSDTGDTDTNDTDTQVSTDDEYAQAACGLLKKTPEDVVLAASESEAAQLTIVADGQPRQLLMPPKGDGWLMLEIPDWMAYVRIFTDDGVVYDISSKDVDMYTEQLPNGACPDSGTTDQLVGFHAWGAYPVRFAEGPKRLWFVAMEEN